MTESEWLGDDHLPLLTAVQIYYVVTATERKKRLLACACCRAIWGVVRDERSRAAVELAEQAADGLVPERVLDQVSGSAWEAYEELLGGSDDGALVAEAAAYAASHASNPDFAVANSFQEVVIAAHSWESGTGLAPSATLAALFRDIFGNPFRPVAVDPVWLTSTVVAIAGGIYDERAFDRLPILADALQDAGCDHADILAHCRGPGPHARGCWVVDLLLGKQ